MLISVSPVPLKNVTFTGQDALTANTYSKSALRAASEEFVAGHEDVDYFPSYKIVTLTDRSAAFVEDNMHSQQFSAHAALTKDASPPAIGTPATTSFDEVNFEVVKSSVAKKTIVAFAGLAQLFGGMTPYNFMNSLKDVNVNVVFVRDPRRTWYNGPIAGLGRRGSEIGARIRQLASEAGSGEIYLLGTSSGGFAALAFAEILRAKRVLTFSPQTSIDPVYLRSVGETRWLELLDRLDRADFIDLVPLLEGSSVRARYDIIVGARVPLDVIYAERLAHLPSVAVHRVDSRHNTAMHLRDKGLLEKVLSDFIDDEPIDLKVL